MLLLLLSGGGGPAKTLSAVAEGILDIHAPLTLSPANTLGALMEGLLTISADLDSDSPPVTPEEPPRFYIWVYNLQGVKVDVIT